MSKKTKIILSFAIVLVLFGIAVYSGNQNPTPEAMTTSKLNDPALVYASEYWAGLCGNGKGQNGGCSDDLYFYNTGRLISDNGFTDVKTMKKDGSTVEKNLGADMVDQVIKKIKDSGIMTKDCPPQSIMDVGWDYQITIDGVKKSFHNVSSDCRDTFDEIDNLLNAAAKIASPSGNI